MSIRSANYYVYRGDQPHSCQGSELSSSLRQLDSMVVEREGSLFQWVVESPNGDPIDVSAIRDSDIFVATDVNNVNYQVSGAQFKSLIVPPDPLVIVEPHVAVPVGTNIYEVTEEALVEGGVEPYTREYFWETFGRADSEIPVLGPGEDRVGGDQPDKPYFSRTSGKDCLVIFSKKAQKVAAHPYSTLDGINWNYLEKIPSVNMKGGKYFDGKYWVCTAGPGSAGVNLITVDPETGDYDIQHKDVASISGATGDAAAVYNVDFNPETGTVIFVGYRKVFRSNYLSDPDLTNVQQISNSGFEYLRPIVCDPNTNEWWMGNNKGEVFYSSNDGVSWTKKSFKYDSGNPVVEAGDFWIDKDYIYWSITSKKSSGKFLRESPNTVTSDDWFYCNTIDKKSILKVGHNEVYYAKGFNDGPDDWYVTYDEETSFPDTSLPIVLSTPATSGVWITVCGSDVIVKNALLQGDPVEGETYVKPNDPNIKALQCTNVVTDKALTTAQVTVPVNLEPDLILSGTQVHKDTLASLSQYDFMPVTRANATSSVGYAEGTFGIKVIAINGVPLDQYVDSNIDEAKITITQSSSGTKRIEGDVTSIQIPGNQIGREVFVGFTPTYAPSHSWVNAGYRIVITGIEP